MESLLKVIQWPSTELDHITFVTRAVRVIDLITNLDMQSFQAHSGISTFITRLELEVEHCRKQQPFQVNKLGLQSLCKIKLDLIIFKRSSLAAKLGDSNLKTVLFLVSENRKSPVFRHLMYSNYRP